MSTRTASPPPKTPATGPLLTAAAAAAYLGFREQTLAAWRSAGRHDLPFVKAGRSIRYRLSDLDAWLAARTRTSTGAAGC